MKTLLILMMIYGCNRHLLEAYVLLCSMMCKVDTGLVHIQHVHGGRGQLLFLEGLRGCAQA